ncbi:MAG TPA: hypothetical protein VF756_27570 [Thermoanaerobaculia bacterium]
MNKAEIQKLLDLPARDKIELAQMLWESIEPDDEQTWEEVKAELRPE